MLRTIGLPELIVLLVFVFVMVLPFWKIFEKAGYPAALSLLMLIPVFNLVMLFFLAFSNWPIFRRVNLRQPAPNLPPGAGPFCTQCGRPL